MSITGPVKGDLARRRLADLPTSSHRPERPACLDSDSVAAKYWEDNAPYLDLEASDLDAFTDLCFVHSQVVILRAMFAKDTKYSRQLLDAQRTKNMICRMFNMTPKDRRTSNVVNRREDNKEEFDFE